MQQVIVNLLENAARYSPGRLGRDRAASRATTGARADRGARSRPRAVGRGAGAHLRPLRARRRREGTSGLGLGLYLCRAIVEQHGGAIGVDSAPGAGATFWIDLPDDLRRRYDRGGASALTSPTPAVNLWAAGLYPQIAI